MLPGAAIPFACAAVNPLECKGNYSDTNSYMKLVQSPLMGGLLHSVQLWTGLGCNLPRPILNS